jgi:hypothetical protein
MGFKPIPKKLVLSVDNPSFSQSVEIKQGFLGSIELDISFIDQNGAYELPEGTTAKLRMLKPDRKQILNNFDVVGNDVIVKVSQQMWAAPGCGYFEIILFNDGQTLASSTCNITIKPSVHNDSNIQSTDEYVTVIEALSRVEAAADKVETIYNNLQSAEQLLADSQEKINALNQATIDSQTATANTNAAGAYAQEKGLLAEQKAQQAQSIMDSASPIINTNLQATYADKATAQKGQSIQCTIADDGLVEVTKIEGATFQDVSVWGNNIVKNGDISSLTSWSGGSLDSTYKKRGSYSAKVVGSSSSPSIFSQQVSVIVGHKYYASAWFLRTSSLNGGSEFDITTIPEMDFAIINDTKLPTIGTWYRLSNVIQATVTATTNYRFYTYSTTPLYGDCFTLFDLTEIFGAGKEPIASQIDAMLDAYSGSWFDGKNILTRDVTTFTQNSPSAEYPALITNASNFSLGSCRKNLLPNYATSKTVNGVTFTVNQDKSITIVGTATSTATLDLLGSFAEVNKIAYFSSDFSYKISGGFGAQVILVCRLANGNYASLYDGSGQINKSGWSNKDINWLYIQINSGTTINTTIYPMIEIGTLATAYEPYKENKISIPYELPAKDTIEKSIDSKIRYIKRIKKEIFDGSVDEKWNVYDNGSVARYYTDGDIQTGNYTIINSLCSHFKAVNNANFVVNTSVVRYIPTSNNYRHDICFPSGKFADISVFKTWLASNPVTIQYELATPIETEIDIELFLTSYKGITNLFSTASAQPTITANFKSQLWSDSYLKDKSIEAAKVGADINNSIVTFVEATVDEDIASGDKISTLFGKILKKFKSLATSISTMNTALSNKFDKSNIVNTDVVNDTTKVPSSAVTYALGIEIDALNTAITNKLNNTSGVAQSTLGTLMVSAVDANTLIHTGKYYCQGVTAVLNYPVTTNGYLEVIGSSISYIFQRYTPVTSGVTKSYVRQQYNGVWTEWNSPDLKYSATYAINLTDMTATYLTITKKGNRVTVNGALGYTAGFPTTQTTIFTINEAGFKPLTNIQVPCEASTSGHSTMGAGLLVVSATGAVQLIQKVASATQITFSFSYDVD